MKISTNIRSSAWLGTLYLKYLVLYLADNKVHSKYTLDKCRKISLEKMHISHNRCIYLNCQLLKNGFQTGYSEPSVRLRLAHFWVLRCLSMFGWLDPFNSYVIIFSNSTQQVFLWKFLCTFFIEISWIFSQSKFIKTKYLCLMMQTNCKLGGGELCHLLRSSGLHLDFQAKNC